jgi:hypothetical protein
LLAAFEAEERKAMTWDERIEKVQKVIDLCIKADAHAFVLIIAGVLMKLHNIEDPGLVLAGLAIFKGRS